MLRIAHFTDFHLRKALPGTSAHCRQRSREVAGLLSKALAQAQKMEADLIVITGDLVDVPRFLVEGMPRGFAMAEKESWYEFVMEDYRTLRGLLETSGLPYIALPGECDSIEAFHQVFPALTETQCRGYRLIPFEDGRDIRGGPRRWGSSRLRFDAALGDSAPCPQIHLQPYPIAGTFNHPCGYVESASMRNMIARNGNVRLCLSGGHHDGAELILSEGTTYGVAPAFCEFPHRWRLLEVGPKKIIAQDQSMEGPPVPRPTVFLDRDGVINDEPSYTWGPERFRLLPGAATAISALNRAGLQVVVVTSQSAIGLGYVPEAVVQAVHEKMHFLLAKAGAHVDAVYYTTSAGPHTVLPELAALPEAKATLLRQAVLELFADPSDAWLVGDRISDIEAARDCGARPPVGNDRGRREVTS